MCGRLVPVPGDPGGRRVVKQHPGRTQGRDHDGGAGRPGGGGDRRLDGDRRPWTGLVAWSRHRSGLPCTSWSGQPGPELIPQEHERRDLMIAAPPYYIKAAPAAPLARRQRRAQPWEARPAHAGPRRRTRPINEAHPSRGRNSANGRPSPSWRSSRHPSAMADHVRSPCASRPDDCYSPMSFRPCLAFRSGTSSVG
jgi:hypothetical protein